MEDGTKTIWLSTKGKNVEDTPVELVNFLQYVGNAPKKNKTDTYNGLVKELENRIREIKRNRDWEAKFMLLQEMIKEERKEAYAQGETNGKVDDILELLMFFGEDIPSAILRKIQNEQDKGVLTKWLKNAAKAESLEEFIQKM